MTDSTKAKPTARMFYIDDSGAEATGWIVYAWVEIDLGEWRSGLRSLLNMRQDLYTKFRMPPSTEVHATKLANGRGNPSTDPTVNQSKAVRRQIVEHALSVIASTSALRIGSVYRATGARGQQYRLEKLAVYQALVTYLDTELAASEQWGMIVMDGDGTDPGYREAHRSLKLARRRIIEDPLFQDSRISQWVQMADLAAWAAYQHLLRHEGKEWAWNWYDYYLAGSDVNEGPVPI